MIRNRLFVFFLLVFFVVASNLFSLDEGILHGTFISRFPYPYRFTILNDTEMKLERISPPNDFHYSQSKTYKYTLSQSSIFLQILLSEDVPTDLWEATTGEMEPWNVGNVLLGLFGVVEGGEESGKIMGVTYSTEDFRGDDIFTVDVPYYVFDGPPNIPPLIISSPSSELQEGDVAHKLRNLDHLKSGFAWVEASDGNGIGESFEVTFNDPPLYMAMINGFISVSNPSLYWKNGRIKTVRIEGLTTGIVFDRFVEDTPNLQTIDVRDLGDETHVRVIITDVYPGETYLDTCLHFLTYSEYAIRPFRY